MQGVQEVYIGWVGWVYLGREATYLPTMVPYLPGIPTLLHHPGYTTVYTAALGVSAAPTSGAGQSPGLKVEKEPG